jgi:hypothetical protein
MPIQPIYCADGNPRFASLAIEAGFDYGAQMPKKIYFSPEFIDQNWRSPNLEKYVEAVAKHMPRLATVLDFERHDQLGEVLKWAESVAPYVREAIIIIPKVSKGVALLPRRIGGVPIRLGYSVPTSFGSSTVHLSEFLGWPIHLLGGSPIVQAQLAGIGKFQPRLIEAPKLDVVSVDCNYHLLMATRYNQFFVPEPNNRFKNCYWPLLKEADGQKWGDGSSTADAPYEAFRRSCDNIMDFWRSH